jgi:DNA repair exonuclease SbcCD ATPase subunit
MITKLSIGGLKGQSREHLLGPLTLLKGPNGSGKTATLQALMIAFLGYEPRLGKRPEATMTLAADSRLSVEVLTDKGFGVTRLFSFDPAKGAVSQEIRLRGRSEMPQKEAEAEIAAHLGNFPVMFDLAEFTSMSADRQRDFIFHLSPLDAREWNADSLAARVTFRALLSALGEGVAAEAMKLRAGEPVSAFEKMTEKRRRAATETLTARLEPALAAALGEVLEEMKAHCSDDVQSSLAGMLAALKARARSARARKAECASAVRALTEERARHADAAAGVEETRAALAEAEARLAALAKAEGADDAKRKEHARRAAEIVEAMRNKRERIAEKECEPLPDIAALKAASDACARAIGEIPEASSFAAEMKAVEDSLAAQAARRDASLKARAGLEAKIENLHAAIDALHADVALFNEGRCPVCGAPADSAHISALIRVKNAEAARLTAEMEEKRRALEAEEKTLDDAGRAARSLAARRAEISARVSGAVEAARSKERELADLERRFALACQERAHRAEAVAALEEEIARLESSLADIPRADAAPGDDGVEECQREIARMRASLAEKDKARSLVATISERIALARKGAVEYDAVRDLTAAAKAVRDALVAEIIGPLQKTVDEILPEIRADYRSYFALTDARGRETFEFGRLRGARRIPFASLSGGETVLFSAALVTALVLRADPPEKALLIEMGELDEANARELLRGLKRISRHLDNVVVASCHGVKAPAGWRTIALG